MSDAGYIDVVQVDPLALTDVVAAGKRDVLPRDELQNSLVVGLGNGMSTRTAKVLNRLSRFLQSLCLPGYFSQRTLFISCSKTNYLNQGHKQKFRPVWGVLPLPSFPFFTFLWLSLSLTLFLLVFSFPSRSTLYIVNVDRIVDRVQCMQWNYITLISRADWPASCRRALPLRTNLFTAPVGHPLSSTPVRHRRRCKFNAIKAVLV